jgi:hypothetical protein
MAGIFSRFIVQRGFLCPDLRVLMGRANKKNARQNERFAREIALCTMRI